MSTETNRLEQPFAVDDKPAPTVEPRSEYKPADRDRGHAGRRAGYVAAVIVNFIMIYVFHNLLRWDAPFLTEDWTAVLPYIDASIWGTIAANVAWMFYDARWFRRLAQIGLNLLGFRVVWAMFTIFPFEFDVYALEQAVRIGLLVGMVGIAIGTAVEAIGLLFGKHND
jgi:hypothetical protein